MLPDWHGLESSVDLQIDYLQKYNPKGTIILHEPITRNFDKEARSFSSGNRYYGVTQLWDDMNLQENWGPSDPYNRLYYFIDQYGFRLGSLDDYLINRERLAEGFKKLVLNNRNCKGGLLPPGKKSFDSMKRDLILGREYIFCESVDNARYEGFKTAVVIAGLSHIKRCAAYLGNTQGYRVKINPLAKSKPNSILGKLASSLDKEEMTMQLAYAEKNKIFEKENCYPLVPIVATAFSEII